MQQRDVEIVNTLGLNATASAKLTNSPRSSSATCRLREMRARSTGRA